MERSRAKARRLWILTAAVYLTLSACPTPSSTPPSATYTLTYSDNGATSGSVPADSSSYAEGQSVAIKGNTGALRRTNYVFAGWNTQANGGGTSYWQGQSLAMGAANMTLYARWVVPTAVGAPTAGYPTYPERMCVTFTNACRLDPVGYRQKWLSTHTSILTTYTAVPPVYWHDSIGAAARAHNDDMYTSGIFQHNSSDGKSWSVRVSNFYTEGNPVGENMISGGTGGGFDAVNMWLIDSDAADNVQPGAGHRANIMSTFPQRIGVSSSHSFWTQDFCMGTLPTHPIASAGHAIITTGITTFLLSYYKPGSAPRDVRLVLDGTEYPLTLALGQADRGTYIVDLPTSSTTRAYYFTVVDTAAAAWRCPGPGRFQTIGEGAGTTDYITP